MVSLGGVSLLLECIEGFHFELRVWFPVPVQKNNTKGYTEVLTLPPSAWTRSLPVRTAKPVRILLELLVSWWLLKKQAPNEHVGLNNFLCAYGVAD